MNTNASTLSDFLKLLGLDGSVVDARNLNLDPILTLEDGTVVTFNRGNVTNANYKPGTTAPAAPTQKVAYFGYPDSNGRGYYTSRSIVVKEGDASTQYLRGLDLDDDSQYKSFLVYKMRNLRFVQEPI